MTSDSTAFRTTILADQRCKTKLPCQNRFVADFETSMQKKFSNISKSEFVSQTPENSEQDNVCRKLEIIERCNGAFIETPITIPAVESSITQRGSVLSLGYGRGKTVRAGHEWISSVNEE
jgi:hypothetical protein